MQIGKRKKLQALALAAALTFSAGGPLFLPAEAAESAVYAAQKGSVRWEGDSNAAVEAYGYGVADGQAQSASRARLLARRAAIADAYRNLAEITRGVQVDAETTVQNLAVRDDTVRVRVESLIQGAEIAEEKYAADGTYSVRMRLPLYGKNGLAAAALPAQRSEAPRPFPQASAKYEKSAAAPARAEKQYTGLIVDARGLGLKPTFSPVLLDDGGHKIYGHENIDPQFAIAHGMVAYTKEAADAQRAESGFSRAGATPLVVKALRLEGHNCNAVVSEQDADFILAMQQKYGFLSQCAVVFER